METLERTRISFTEIPSGLLSAMQNTEKYIKACGIPHDLIELIKTRASQINHCGYCIDMHHKDALKAGEQFQRLYLLPAWQEAPCYTDEEKAVLRLTDVLTEIAKHEPETIERAFEGLLPYYSKEQIANIVLAIGQINIWNRMAITFGNVPGTYKVQ
ncbi:MAG TPA: carboxymuconolactone decarboxylase family protein [Cyclobacteriaceae bacterium]|nr:carboxymuconolactone decarboxylase family protein [Cyclobacteriaceae bacterium]